MRSFTPSKMAPMRRNRSSAAAAPLNIYFTSILFWTTVVLSASTASAHSHNLNPAMRLIDAGMRQRSQVYGYNTGATSPLRRTGRASKSAMLVSSSSSSSTAPSSSKGTDTMRAGAVRTMSSGRMQIFNLLSGAISGSVASTLTAPLDVIKTQLQSSSVKGSPLSIARSIVSQEGVPGLFRGLPPTLIGIIPSRSTYFWAYETSKRIFGQRFGYGTGNALVSGLSAGLVGNTVTNPIWMVKTRMQLMAQDVAGAVGQKQYNGYIDAIKTIRREEGFGGFYRGITASYWGCIEGSIQFVLYEKIKKTLLDRENARRAEAGLPPTTSLPKLVYFTSAACSKCIASIATYPHEVARTRMRERASASGVFRYTGMWRTLGIIAREEGRVGLYSGMGTHLARVVPNSAIMFLTYEIVNSWLSTFVIVESK